MKASNISETAGIVQQHMHRTIMYLDHALSASVFLYSLLLHVCVRVGGAAMSSFTVSTLSGGKTAKINLPSAVSQFCRNNNDDPLPLSLLLVNFFMPCMLLLMWINQLRHSHERRGHEVNLRENTSRGCLSAHP